MGESYMAGTEYRDATAKESMLEEALQLLAGHRWLAILKTDETTVLVETEITINQIIRREDRIETGHLTLDEVYFEAGNEGGLKLFFPLVQFRHRQQYSTSLNVYFDNYWWTFRPVGV